MKRKAKIYYIALDDFWRKEKKLEWIRENPIQAIAFERIEPDAKNNWINQTDNDWDSLLPLIDKDVKAGKSEKAIFKLFSSGLKTQRDEWIYDFSKDTLEAKMRYFVDVYESSRKDKHFPNKMKIKWDDDLSTYLKRGIKKQFDEKQIIISSYRPYSKRFFYFDKHFNGRTYQWQSIYRDKGQKIIGVPGIGSSKDFHTLAIDKIMDLNSLPAGGQYLPLYTFDSENQKHENITDWALNQFQTHYKESDGAKITKQDIFYYTYAVLHSPAYRKKYEQNLKREFPRLPLYADFFQWRDWGEQLMDLHINYETQAPFALERKDLDLSAKRKIAQASMFDSIGNEKIENFVVKPQTKLRAGKENGAILIDSLTTLTGVPALAWEYKLGNRSALEWILDQYKEKKPQDATIRERFNAYKFEDYKEQVIDLLKRVTAVSVETMNIIKQMPD